MLTAHMYLDHTTKTSPNFSPGARWFSSNWNRLKVIFSVSGAISVSLGGESDDTSWRWSKCGIICHHVWDSFFGVHHVEKNNTATTISLYTTYINVLCTTKIYKDYLQYAKEKKNIYIYIYQIIWTAPQNHMFFTKATKRNFDKELPLPRQGTCIFESELCIPGRRTATSCWCSAPGGFCRSLLSKKNTHTIRGMSPGTMVNMQPRFTLVFILSNSSQEWLWSVNHQNIAIVYNIIKR